MIVPIQTTAAAFNTSASARTVSTTANITAGNMVVVCVGFFNTGVTLTVTDSLGNTYSQAGTYAANGGNRAAIFYSANVTGGACTVTVTPSATAYLSIGVTEYSGQAGSPLDGTANASGSTGTPGPGSISVAGASELIVVATSVAAAAAATIGNLPMRFVQTNGSSAQPVIFHDGFSDTTISPIATTGGSAAWASCGASFKPASAGGAGGIIVTPSMAGVPE